MRRTRSVQESTKVLKSADKENGPQGKNEGRKNP